MNIRNKYFDIIIKLSIFLLLISVISCKKGHWTDCIESAGENLTDSLLLENFDTVKIYDVFNIFLIQDTINFILINGGSNIIENISVNILDNTLELDNFHQCMCSKPAENSVNLYLHFKNIAKIDIHETSKLISVNSINSKELGVIFNNKISEANFILNCNTFYFWNLRGGVLNLSGKTRELKIWNYGLCNVFADSLISEKALIENNSMGNCRIGISDTLKGKITNSGNVYYKGNPLIENFILESKSGKLIKIE